MKITVGVIIVASLLIWRVSTTPEATLLFAPSATICGILIAAAVVWVMLQVAAAFIRTRSREK